MVGRNLLNERVSIQQRAPLEDYLPSVLEPVPIIDRKLVTVPKEDFVVNASVIEALDDVSVGLIVINIRGVSLICYTFV